MPEQTTADIVASFEDVSYDPANRQSACDLTMQLLDRQEVHGQVPIDSGVLGIVVDGLETYTDDRVTGTFDIPQTYSEWDETFGDETFTDEEGQTRRVVNGPLGLSRDTLNELALLSYDSRFVKAAVRLVTRGGRYSTDRLTGYLGIPFAVVVHDSGRAIAIAPTNRGRDVPDSDRPYPDFMFTPANNMAVDPEPTEEGDPALENWSSV